MSHFLDLNDSSRIHNIWPCDLERGVFEIRENADETVMLVDTGVKKYVIEAAGYYGQQSELFDRLVTCYLEDLDGNFIDFASLNHAVHSDTLTLDFSNGPILLQIENQREWTVEFALNKVDISVDTINLNPITLNSGDSVEIFQQIDTSLAVFVSTDGTYQTSFNCAIYVQEVISNTPLSTINLGDTTLCIGNCLYTPNGETIACETSNFSFLSSDNILYEGTLMVDSSATLSLQTIDYTCDSVTGEWLLDLSWTGSAPPFSLNGLVLQTPSGQAGPFQSGQTVDIALSGSSACVDSLFINGSYSCVSSVFTLSNLGFEVIQRSASVLEISAPSHGWDLSIVDVLGREVLGTPLQQDANQLYIGELIRGTYFIVVQNGSEMASEKWVKR